MDGPDGSIDNICNYSSSQEDILTNALIVRQEEFPESQPSPESSDPLPTPDGPGIIICSAPTTQNSNPEVDSLVEEFSTPPEEARASSSEEPLPQMPDMAIGNPSNGNDQDKEEIVTDDADSGVGTNGNPKLGFLAEKSSEMAGLGSGEKVLVGNVCGVRIHPVGDNKSGKKRVRKSSAERPSKKAKVADEGSGLSTPNVPVEVRLSYGEKANKVTPMSFISPEKGKRIAGVAASAAEKDDEGEPSLNDMKLPFPAEVDDVEDKLPNVKDSDVNKGIGIVRTDASDPVFTEVDGSSKEQEEGGRVGNQTEKMETTCQYKSDVPPSITQYMQEDGSRCGGGKDGSDPAQVKNCVLEILAFLAGKSRKDKVIDEDFDFLETAKKRGMKFPRPRWW